MALFSIIVGGIGKEAMDTGLILTSGKFALLPFATFPIDYIKGQRELYSYIGIETLRFSLYWKLQGARKSDRIGDADGE